MTDSGLSTIGYFVWWSIKDVKIAREDLQKHLDNVGLDYKVPDVKVRSAFLKAVREVRRDHRNKGLLIRQVQKDAEEYIFGLVDENVDKTKKSLDYAHTTSLKFSPISGRLSCTKPHRAHQLIKDLYDKYMGYLDADDVRDVILKLVSATMSVSVRQRGGIYFIPNTHRYTVDRLEKFVDLLPESCDFMVAPQIDVESSKKAIYKAFVGGLRSQMADFAKEMEGDDNKKRASTMTKRLKEFKVLKNKIEFYRDAMQFQVEDLSKDLEDLKTAAESRILG